MIKKSVLLVAAAFALTACSDDSQTTATTAPADAPKTEASTTVADNKLETRFVTIATGGA